MIITHTCRTIDELGYSKEKIKECHNDPLIKEFVSDRLINFHSTTREKYSNNGRITDLISTGKLFTDLNIEAISENDRFMFCGSMGLNNDLKKIMLKYNLCEGANNNPGDFVLEKAFVD